MAPPPPASEDVVVEQVAQLSLKQQLQQATPATALVRTPLEPSGTLDKFARSDVTPHIGTEFARGVQLTELLAAPNAKELIRDLAILISRRGVVFFRDQNIDLPQQKQLGQLLGELSGKPATSGLHVHPLIYTNKENDPEISVITSEGKQDYYTALARSELASQGWHSDITFEKIPSDYAILKIHTLPTTGGDTLWASGYEVYDRISPKVQEFLKGLDATHKAEYFNIVAKIRGQPIAEDRGAPENKGTELVAVHPVIRTNPVTGWNSVFANKIFTHKINEVTKDESDTILTLLSQLFTENHDLQVRFKWNKNDVAIWDNRSVLHTATNDYGDEVRVGDRVVSLGEKPYFDPAGSSRRESLGLKSVREERYGKK